MLTKYPATRLGAVATIVMGQSPPGDTYNEVGQGLPFYQGVVDFGSRYPSRRVYCSTPTRIAEPDDIMFSVRAPIGRVNIAVERCAIGRGLAVVRPHDPKDRVFVEFVLRAGSTHLWSMFEGGGSVFGNARRDDLESLEIVWPPIEERRAIAAILGALDDKIELNRRMNETLEAMARALFKSWFLDFGPFRDQGIENSPLGPIPKGWTVKSLDQIAQFLNGLALQKYPPDDGGYLPVIKIAELRRGITESSDKANLGIPPEYVVSNGDVLFSWSGSLEVVIWCGGKGALNQHLFKVTSADYPKWFFYHWIRHYLPDFQAIAAGKATTMGHIQRHHLTAALVTIPPTEVLKRKDKSMAPLLDRVIVNLLESHALAALRDSLLPKLLSGEIRVKDAEKFVEARI